MQLAGEERESKGERERERERERETVDDKISNRI